MTRSNAVLLVACTGTILGGCAAQDGRDRRLSDSSESIVQTTFVAPHDPAMGQVVLAVPQVTVSAPAANGMGDLGQAVRSQLTSALASSPNFLIADRSALGDLADEHRLADSGGMVEADRPVKGQLAGARYLVKADVTELKEHVLGRSSGGGLQLGRVFDVLDNFFGGAEYQVASDVAKSANPSVGKGQETIEGVVGIEVLVVDVDTGLVVANARAQGKLTRKNTATVLGIAGLSTSSREFSDSVIAHASRAAAQDATRAVHDAIRRLVLASPSKPAETTVAQSR